MVLVPNPGKPSVFECIDTTEVTRNRYETWLKSGTNPDSMPSACAFDALDHTPQSYWPPNGLDLDHPVTFVDWCDAYAYCATMGKRLCGRFEGGAVPTQSHLDPKTDTWFAACSSGGTQQFPYGNDFSAMTCNGAELKLDAATSAGTLTGCVTPSGAFDMSGNVWEWEDSCAGSDGGDDMCMMRGGGYLNYSDNLACTASSQGKRKSWSVSIGFRCCAAAILAGE